MQLAESGSVIVHPLSIVAIALFVPGLAAADNWGCNQELSRLAMAKCHLAEGDTHLAAGRVRLASNSYFDGVRWLGAYYRVDGRTSDSTATLWQAGIFHWRDGERRKAAEAYGSVLRARVQMAIACCLDVVSAPAAEFADGEREPG
ncbi:MAG: hypothetical protein AAFX44_02695 [Pseudomonadota bacterium]